MIHWTVVGAVVLVAGIFVTGRVVSTLLQRVGGGPTVVSQVATVLQLVALVGGYTVTVLTEPGSLAASATGSTVAAVATNALVASVLVVAGALGITRGLGPVVDEMRPGTYTFPDRFRRRRWRALFGGTLALAAVAEVLRLGLVGVSVAWVGVAAAVTWAAYLIYTYPLWMPPVGGVRVRDPTEAERVRVERCYERFGRSPGRIVIATEDAFIGANAAGRGAYHTVGITEQFLERVDDTTLAVVLAEVDERAATGYWKAYVCNGVKTHLTLWAALFALPAFLLEIFTTSIPVFWFLLPLLVLLTTPLLAWPARRSVYKADAFVGSQFDTSTVTRVYRQLGEELRYHDVPDGPLGTLYALDPAVEDRLERLGIVPSAAETTASSE